MSSGQCERTRDCPSRAVYQYGSCHSGASRNLAGSLNAMHLDTRLLRCDEWSPIPAPTN
jgi:hypothetical protein